jgi:hypothetical protein
MKKLDNKTSIDILLFPRYSGEVISRKLYQTQALYLVNTQKRSHHLNSRQTPHHHVPLKLKHRPLPFIPHLSPAQCSPLLPPNIPPPASIHHGPNPQNPQHAHPGERWLCRWFRILDTEFQVCPNCSRRPNLLLRRLPTKQS